MTTRRRYCGAGKKVGVPGEFLIKSEFLILNYEKEQMVIAGHLGVKYFILHL